MGADGYSLEPLLEMVDRLRGEDGCPWDRRQTPETFVRYLADEAGELIEAVSESDPENIHEEYGDVVFLIAFLTRLLEESCDFDYRKAVSGVMAKMRRRHPHVFSGLEVTGEEQVVLNWKRIKEQEKSGAEPGLDSASGAGDEP